MLQKNEKHVFPDDWRKISDKEAIEHIEHLIKHCQEYEIKVHGEDIVTINNINFNLFNTNLRNKYIGRDFKYSFYVVNHQKTYDSVADAGIYVLIKGLIDICKQASIEQKAKAEKRAKVDTVIGTTVICGLFIWGMIFITDQLPNILKTMENLFKTNKIENTSQQQSLPKDNEYVLTQQQIQNYRDTLKQVVK